MQCDCKRKHEPLEVEVGDTIYEIEFGKIQIGITGRCNMRCDHCRAAHQQNVDMPVEQVVKIIQFARQFGPDSKEIIVSGGEPLLHSAFCDVMRSVKENGGEFVTLTTNGSMLTAQHLELFEELKFGRLQISISLDSSQESKHDSFRHYQGAFAKANKALAMVVQSKTPNLTASIRCTIKATQIPEMEAVVEHANSLGCQRISFSAIHPAGQAINRDDLWMSSSDKFDFIREVYRLKTKYPHLNVTTGDPLKCLLQEANELADENELVFDGCGAGVIAFNVNADGTMTPCALLNTPMMNVFPMSITEITENYKQNPFVQSRLAMNLKGRCGICERRYQCGGCRARALIQNGDILGEDPHCWLKVIP
ncbi:MAG: radical SAM protein [Planctomycetaceae bacterium]|nr:radical SAM protein [Planctomycetaceae bacterium]